MKIRELTKEQFQSTFSERMNDITHSADEIVDIWSYVELLEREKYHLNDDLVDSGVVELVYANSANTYQHILIATAKENHYLIIVVDIKAKNIFGHYLLDLNNEYGL